MLAAGVLYYLKEAGIITLPPITPPTPPPTPPPPGVCEIDEVAIPGQKKCDDKGNLCVYTDKGWMLLEENSSACKTTETHTECVKVGGQLICLEQPGAGVDECIPGTVWGCPCTSKEECGPEQALVECFEGRCYPQCINMLDKRFPKPQYSAIFTFDTPCVANRIEGEIEVDALWNVAWRNVDIWLISPDGTKKRVAQEGWYPWATTIQIRKTFSDFLVQKVHIWGGGGPAGGQAEKPALKEIHVMLRKF